MRRFSAGCLLVCCIAASASTDTNARAVKQYSIEQFMNTASISGAAFSPDERKILYSSDQSGIFNAYSVSIEGGAPTQLTHSTDDAIKVISYLPTDERFLYSADHGGNELYHIYLRNEDGSVKDLTPDEKSRAVFGRWSFDKQSFFFEWNKRDPKFMDLYQMDVATWTPKLVYQNDAGYQFQAISDDQHYVALSKPISTDNSDLYLYDLQSKELKHISPHEGDANFGAEAFTVDSKSLYIATNEGTEFVELRLYDIATGKSEKVVEASWDVLFASLSRKGKYRVTGLNRDAVTEIQIQDMESHKALELPALPAGEIRNVVIADGETRMAFYGSDSRSSSNLYVYDVGTKKLTRLTDTMSPEIAPADLVEGKVVRFKSYDGLEVPGIYYEPLQAEDGKVPALLWIHGGPGGQSRLGFSALIQFLVNHGYAVYAVNNRGSSGYGKSFHAADDRKHGEADLDDCVAAKKYLESTGVVDMNRVGILGGSYGGYMVLAALAFRPQEFAVGVDLFGVSNWPRTLESVPPWWESFRQALYREMGDPKADAERLRRISPLFHAEKIVKPLLVLQGVNDPRVLKQESDEIVAAVKKNGVPVEYVLFEDEGHGFLGKKNQIRGYQAMLEFLDRHLKNGAGS